MDRFIDEWLIGVCMMQAVLTVQCQDSAVHRPTSCPAYAHLSRSTRGGGLLRVTAQHFIDGRIVCQVVCAKVVCARPWPLFIGLSTVHAQLYAVRVGPWYDLQ